MGTYQEMTLAAAEAIVEAAGGTIAGLSYNEAIMAAAAQIVVDGGAGGGGGGGGGWAQFGAVATWQEPYIAENASNSVLDNALILARVVVPTDLLLSGLSTRWGAGTVGDVARNVVYNSDGNLPTTLFAGGAASAGMAATDSWASIAFTELLWPAGEYWYGTVGQIAAASRPLFFSDPDVALGAWMTNPNGTGADPSLNFGNTGRVALQSGVSGAVPATFAGALTTDGNDGKVPPAMWFKVRAA